MDWYHLTANLSMYRKTKSLIKAQFGYDLLPIKELLDTEVRQFGIHITVPMEQRARTIGGCSTPTYRVATIKVCDVEEEQDLKG